MPKPHAQAQGGGVQQSHRQFLWLKRIHQSNIEVDRGMVWCGVISFSKKNF